MGDVVEAGSNSSSDVDDDVEAGSNSSSDVDDVVEAGSNSSSDVDDDVEAGSNSDEDEDPDRFSRWRQAALVLNSSRQFRYTLGLVKKEEKEQKLRKIRSHAQAIRAAQLYRRIPDVEAGSDCSPDVDDDEDHRTKNALVDHLRRWRGWVLAVIHKDTSIAWLFLVLEAISVVLDLIGKSKLVFLLAAFLLSGLSFVVVICVCNDDGTIAERQIGVTEVALASVQLIGTLIHYLLAVFRVKDNYNASLIPLVFAIVALCFAIKKDRLVASISPDDDTTPAHHSHQPNNHER